jgi:multidrug efflux pump subunit AcrA (membrane-fusion protein)
MKNLLKAIIAGIAIVMALQLFMMSRNPVMYVPGNGPSATPPSAAVTASSTPTAQPPAVATEDIPVRFRVSGRIDKMLALYHAQVHKGDVIATLETPSFEQALTGAQARLKIAIDQSGHMGDAPNPNFNAIEGARARVEDAQDAYDNAHQEREKRETQLVPGQLDNVYADDVQNEHDAQLNLAAAHREMSHQEAIGRAMLGADGYKAAVQIARNNVAAAESTLADTRLLAPADGVITGRNVESGTLITPSTVIYTMTAPVQ